MKRWLLGCLALCAACHGTGRRSAPQQPLERGLFFVERDDHGRPWPVSAREASGTEVERLADGATVDVNSTLRIELRRDELGSPNGRLVRTDLLQRARDLGASLEGFAGLVEAEARATTAWRDLGATALDSPERAAAYERFAAERRSHAEALERFLGPLRDLWPRDDPAREEVEGVVDALLSTRPGSGPAQAHAREILGRLLQGKVDRLSADLEGLESDARAVVASRALRIEGFVIPSEGAERAHAVHVAGYDSLDEQRVESIDRQGIRLTESERGFLLETSRATHEVAAALERVRLGEATLAEALAGAQTGFGRALEARVAEIESLAGELSSAALRARADRTQAAFDAFLRDARAQAEAWTREREEALRSSLQAWLARSPDLAALARSIEDAKSLSARWRAATGETLPALAFDTAAAADALGESLRRIRLAELEPQIAALVEGELEGAPDELRGALASAFASSGFQAEVQGWRDLAGRARTALENLRTLLGGAPPAAVPTGLANPQAFDVPLDLAPDAEIRLERTTRRAGDRLLVRAKLLENAPGGPPREVESLSATLHLEKLGWHADLDPSVVIVTADQLAGADDNGGFSAALGWMWSYGPRDDEDDPYLSRSLEWSAGLHAVFLNFGPDNDPEIGLGATIGVWDGRIQIGAGYNPFAEDDRDGRFYYYVGSSLVPLLQALAPGT